MKKSYGQKLSEAGYNVHPICPPDVTVYGWENRGSTEKPDWREIELPQAAGKAPGHFTGSRWKTKKGWRKPSPWSKTYDSWPNSGVGVLCGGDLNIIGLDFDITHTDASRYIYQQLQQKYGPLPARVGLPPKFLIPARSEEPIGKLMSAAFNFPTQSKPSRLEVLATGQQFVAYGIHPTTMLPYQWYVKSLVEIPPDQLRVFTRSELLGLEEFVTEVLEKFGGVKAAEASRSHVSSTKINRDNLYAEDPDEVINLLRIIPPPEDRETRIQVAYNIVGALGKTDVAYDLWYAWCDQLEGWHGKNSVAVWQSIKEKDIRSGINALYERARPHAERLLAEANQQNVVMFGGDHNG